MASDVTPPRLPRRGVTISDVARHAGVAPSTVSYALSGKRTVSEPVRRRIERTIEELGYRPHAGARALASRRSQILALMMPLRTGVYVPILMEFAAAIVTEARSHDHDVLLLTGESGSAGLQRVAAGAMADAVVLMDVEEDDTRVPTLRELGRPAVLLGLPDDRQGLVCCDLDWEAAGRLAVASLAELGHRRIGLIGQPTAVHERHTGFARRFTDGLHDEGARRGVHTAQRPGEATFGELRAALDALAAELDGLTALVVHNEAIVPLVLEELSSRGVEVPGQLSVVCVAPQTMAAASRLTGVSIPVEDIGRRAVQLVMQQLDAADVAPVTLLPPDRKSVV